MKSKTSRERRGLFKWLPGVLISLIAIYAIIRIVSWDGLQLAFSKINFPYLLLGLGIYLISLVARGMAWRILLQKKANLRQTFLALNVGYLVSNIFPFRLGEFARAFLLGAETKLGSVRVLSSIVIERAFDLAIAASLIISMLPLALALSWAKPVAIGTLLVVLTGFLILYLLAMRRDQVKNWFVNFSENKILLKKMVLPHLDPFFQGLAALKNPFQFISSLGCMVLSWGLAILEYYILLLQFVPGAKLWWLALCIGILGLGIALPSAPAAIGVWEASLIAGLAIFKVDATQALAYAVLIHFMNFVTNGSLGLYGLARAGKTLSSLMNDLGMRKKEKEKSTELP